MTDHPLAIPGSTWQETKEAATFLVQSGLLPNEIRKPEAAIAIMLTGSELGMKPMESFRFLNVINGKPSLNSAGMTAMVQRYITAQDRGGYLRTAEWDELHCTIEWRRTSEEKPQSFTFSLDDARKAGLLSNQTWNKYPKHMLYARAVSTACRTGFPDVLAGVMLPDEIDNRPMHVLEVLGDDDPELVALAADDPAPPDLQPLMKAVHAAGAEKGLDHDAVRSLAFHTIEPIESLKELSADQLKQLLNNIKDLPEGDDILEAEYEPAIGGNTLD